MNNNVFEMAQEKGSLKTRILTTAFINQISDCVRKASKVIVANQKAFPTPRKQYLEALVAQAVAVDCLNFVMKYGANPEDCPKVFQFLKTDDTMSNHLIDRVFQTYPVYLKKMLNDSYDKHEDVFEVKLGDLYNKKEKNFTEATATNLRKSYLKALTLKKYMGFPLSLKLLAKETEQTFINKYEMCVKPQPHDKEEDGGECH